MKLKLRYFQGSLLDNALWVACVSAPTNPPPPGMQEYVLLNKTTGKSRVITTYLAVCDEEAVLIGEQVAREIGMLH